LYNRPEVAAVPRDFVPPHKIKKKAYSADIISSDLYTPTFSDCIIMYPSPVPFVSLNLSPQLLPMR
jgi:hypothetical protein